MTRAPSRNQAEARTPPGRGLISNEFGDPRHDHPHLGLLVV